MAADRLEAERRAAQELEIAKQVPGGISSAHSSISRRPRSRPY